MQFHVVGGARLKPSCLFTAAPAVLDQPLLLTAPALAFFFSVISSLWFILVLY
jgi:hypothetical protein